MQLAIFIHQNLEAILVEWERFASSILPASKGMNSAALRDHAREMLIAIATDMQSTQSPSEQQAKSEGRKNAEPQTADSAAEMHANHRAGSGFTLIELVSEYRALRATVVRLWTRDVGRTNHGHLEELVRFNEAIDEALSESVASHTSRIGHARDLLLGALGHDLRNPLGAVLQSAHFLLRTEALGAAQTRAAARIVNSGTRMKDMITDLLDFASTRLGDRLPVNLVHVDMEQVCRMTAEEISALYPNHEVIVQCDGDLSGRWDTGRIAQMLSNLLGNAVKHGAADGPIRLAAVGTDARVRIEIHNEGVPIAIEHWRSIFEPLTHGVTSHTRGSDPNRSVGLGLYIASEIAKAHGGTLQLTRSDRERTIFAIDLPRAARHHA